MKSINLNQQQSVQQFEPVEQAPPAREDGALWDAGAAAGNTVEGFGDELAGLGHLAAAGGLVAAAIFSWLGEGTQRASHDTSSQLMGAASDQVAASEESSRNAWASYGSAAKHVGRIAQGAVRAMGEFLFGR